MKIVFYNETILSGGIEKCLELLSTELKTDYEIEIVYTDDTKLDENIFNLLKQNAYIHKLDDNEIINADICIWCRIYFDYKKLYTQIKAKKNYLWIHSKPMALPNCLLENSEFMNSIDKIICVSEAVKAEAGFIDKSIVIHNFVPKNIYELANEISNPLVDIPNNQLKLLIVSRLSSEKGFDRVEAFVKSLINNNVNFVLNVIGKGRRSEPLIKEKLKKYKQVKFLGYKENPYPYIKHSDFLLVLSDYETWGNVITESKVLNTPCIVSDFSSAKEQIENGKNGLIIPLSCEDYTQYIKELQLNQKNYKENLKSFEYTNEIDKWEEILK